MIIRPVQRLRGVASVPGDKSISHRAAILGAMGTGETRISNFSTAGDCLTTLNCLEHLGVDVRRNGSDILINGVGPKGFERPSGAIDCGNSGTTARMLAGVLAAQDFESVLTGDASLSARPMERITGPLKLMGAAIVSEGGHLPLHIAGRGLHGIQYAVPVASAQVRSCILLASLLASGRTTVSGAPAARDHTERLLAWLGVDVQRTGDASVTLHGPQTFTGKPVSVPGDMSSAAFLIAAAACLPGSDLVIENVGMNPTRTAFVELLKDCGANIEGQNITSVSNEPRGLVRVRGGLDTSRGIIISGDRTAGLIDELPIVAVIGTQLDGGVTVRDARELRRKETDRIAAVVTGLRRMAADVIENEDGFVVKKSRLAAGAVDSFDDHRIAMAFAVAGLLADGETEVKGTGCVDISFPGFFDTVAKVAEL
jgi:3-phosphoshikimate 1-carboxyvinyltransferase